MREWIIPPEPLRVLWLLERAGYAAYIVGGSLRDSLLGRLAHDWDVTTAARPEQMLSLFSTAGYRTIPTGLKHGTVTVLIDRPDGTPCPIECTTHRLDGDYTDARHPDSVRFSDDVADDLSRRDFTVNAMACRVKAVASWEDFPYIAAEGLRLREEDVELLDLFGGQDDLGRGVLRCVGNAAVRFSEDALRILRAVRFCVQLGFALDAETEAAITVTRGGLAHVSAERISAECNRMLAAQGKKASAGLSLMSRTGLWQTVLPEADFRHHPYFSDEALLFEAVDALPYEVEPRFALLLLGAGGAGVRAAGRRLKWSNRQLERTACIVRALCELPTHVSPPLNDADLRRWMARYGTSCEDSFLIRAACDRSPDRQIYERAYARCQELRARGDCLSIAGLALDGTTLMQACGVRGAAVGRLLSLLLEAVLDDPANNTEQTLLSLAKRQMEQN